MPPSSKAPDMKAGVSTSRFVGPKACPDRLLKNERDAEGREQGLERTSVEEADDAALDDDACDARDEEGGRYRQGERKPDIVQALRAHCLLDREARIGAEHHHLAMSHVDHAHDAEGDSEPDGGKQQHGSERQPVPGVLQNTPKREAVLHGRGSGIRRGL